ncbi:NfeD family protein [Zavarzinia sp.]|uniref:NfeD family protein n=1 Tax=Zavarzinia sp. TaxID=2027920 RepID=UPI003567E86C
MVYWHWYAFALVLIILEILAPGVIFLWLAIGAVAAGSLVALLPEVVWYVQFATFAVATALSLLLGHNLLRRATAVEDGDSLNQRSQALVGSEAVLIEGIANGVGRIRLGDTSWAVTGPDSPAGTRVRVVAAEGARLRVERT